MKKIVFIVILIFIIFALLAYAEQYWYRHSIESNNFNIINSNTQTVINKDTNNYSSNTDFERIYNEAINNLDINYFLVDAENYFPESNTITITEERAKEIAQIGFIESANRIAGEGTENVESERVSIEEKLPNNYFTRYYYEGDKVFKTSVRNCFVVTRENDMGCGVSIYVDANTGLIIGGEAFGD